MGVASFIERSTNPVNFLEFLNEVYYLFFSKRTESRESKIVNVNKEELSNDNMQNGGINDERGKSENVPGAKEKGSNENSGKQTIETNTGAGGNNRGSTERLGRRGIEGESRLPDQGTGIVSSSKSSSGNSIVTTEGKPTTTGNFRITDNENCITYNQKQVYKDNITAIRTLKNNISRK